MATATHEIHFVPNPVQREFIESKNKASLYSSRMGEGKSTAIAWADFVHTRLNPGARWAIIRDTWENLRATTMKTFFEWFPPGIMGEFKQSTKTFTWAEGVAKGEVEFLGMDNPEDASKLMSRELSGIGMDEPAPAVGSAGIDELIFDIGIARLRQNGPGIKWRVAKLAVNNPDESHWTYQRFVAHPIDGFRVFQPATPENEQNLPEAYYAELRKLWAHRPDLIRRFVEGNFGYQQEGKAVTPQWDDRIHLATGLAPVKGGELIIMWDWGHNPTAVISQITPLGTWQFLDAIVGDGIGAEELIMDAVRPLVERKYKGFAWQHIGDNAGTQREQTSIHRSAVRFMLKSMGGKWRSGPIKLQPRVDALQAALKRNGLIKVDRRYAKAVWHALRGGWHYPVSRTGIVGGEPVKNIHSHPGDAVSYGAAVLYPIAKWARRGSGLIIPNNVPSYWGVQQPGAMFGPGTQITMPEHGSGLPLPK